MLLRVALLGILISVLAVALCAVLSGVSRVYRNYLPQAYHRVMVGGALVVLLSLLVGTSDYNGAGMEMIEAAVSGIARPEAFALKILLTALTLGAGFKGGEVVPVLLPAQPSGAWRGPCWVCRPPLRRP
ncbi:hypothetical protein SDC9_146702 [bioreactor metagenome]|uniref:Voltage-gated ClC-type chloride channel ClcB n=1 Tax=bioreactor metagenome TaxID=1076179 RepID=A0A645ECD8_9ZZZZ